MTDFGTTLGLVGQAATTLLDAESVVYTPNGGSPRTIDALIDRLGIDPGMDVPAARLTVRQHATLGVDAASIDTGGDTVAWPAKRGGSNRTSRIHAIAHADAGVVILEVL